MKFILIGLLVLTATSGAWARGKTAASSSEGDPQIAAAINQWMAAYQKGDVASLTRLSPSAQYSQLLLVGNNLIQKRMDSSIHPVTEYRIERMATLIPGQLAVAAVQEIVEDAPTREWEATFRLKNTGGGWQVTHVNHVAIETHVPGYPTGCPETVIRREEEANLDGPVRGPSDTSMIRVFKVRTNTESWGAPAELDIEKCQMKPGRVVENLEWLVTNLEGELLALQVMGRREQEDGVTLFSGSKNGSLTRGGVRLETIVPNDKGVVFLSRESHSSKGAVARLSAYEWRGDGFKNIWNFDFIKKGAAFAVDLEPSEGGKRVVAKLLSGGDAVGCPEGTVIPFAWTGSGFKVAEKVKGGCTSSAWRGDGGGREKVTFPPADAGQQEDAQGQY